MLRVWRYSWHSFLFFLCNKFNGFVVKNSSYKISIHLIFNSIITRDTVNGDLVLVILELGP